MRYLALILMLVAATVLIAQNDAAGPAGLPSENLDLSGSATQKAQPVDNHKTELLKAQPDTLGQNLNLTHKSGHKKNAARAMVLSALIPGAGQFYADRSSWTTYLFPVLEVGLWAGYLHYNKKGDDKEDEYKRYADAHYNRDHQVAVQQSLINAYPDSDTDFDRYTTSHFRLDTKKTQHYYEDIGKYDKYIFGWDDWYATYASDGHGNYAEPEWGFDTGDTDPDHTWIGNRKTNDPTDTSFYAPASAYRAHYVDMRKKAEDYYNVAHVFVYGIMFNHMAASLDAVRVTKKHNLGYLETGFNWQVQPMVCAGGITPMLNCSLEF